MNEKAAVTKELNDKHRKIIDGLLKLPDNKECADCKSKGPRWASVNLGIFLCMQCSGIHRSLGVHISKVRSAALDTWLPDQVAFIQKMGNKRANSYWEAELPPNYDRVGIENFIRAKYEEKRWVSRDKKFMSPSKALEEISSSKQRSNNTDEHKNSEGVKVSEKQEKNPQTTKKTTPMVPKLPCPAFSEQNLEAGRTMLHSEVDPVTVKATETTQKKVDNTVDLLDLLSVDDPTENGAESSSVDDNGWANFQSAQLTSILENNSTTESAESKNETAPEVASSAKSVENKNETVPGVQDLSKDSASSLTSTLENNSTTKSVETKNEASVSQTKASKKPSADVKNDIMSLFDKANMVSPFALHQQQLAFLSQQQSHLMGAAKSDDARSSDSDSNATKGNITAQGWPTVAYQVPGNTLAGQMYSSHLSKMGNAAYLHPSGGYLIVPAPGLNAPESTAPAASSGTNNSHASSSPSASSNQSLSDYDFSSLTQGMFSKH